MLTYATLCSGIEGFGYGFDRAGMQCIFQCEIEKSCRRVLERHYPGVPRTADVNDEQTASELVRLKPGLVAFGSPCQDLSVAGRRAGLDAKRSGLFYRCMELAFVSAARVVCWENVPGALSSNGGKDFASVLEAFTGARPCVPERGWRNWGFGVGPVCRVAWRILDAQWFGVAQRRRRVFVIGCPGNRTRAAEILFEPESLPWDSPPSREAGADVAAGLTSGTAKSRGVNPPGRRDVNVIVSLNAHMGMGGPDDNAAQGGHLVAFQCHGSNVGPMGTFRSGNAGTTDGVPFVFQSRYADNSRGKPSDVAYALTDHGSGGQTDIRPQCVDNGMRIRRLTVTECERLQGFPDGWTEGESDSARYRMLGNAVATVVSQWLGKQIAETERT